MSVFAPPAPGTRAVDPSRLLARQEEEAQRRRGLRRMKVIALGLLLLAAAVFVVTTSLEDSQSWLSPVRAMAEAAMVGALADWFAVTALFRHPLGIPIPHTAIIPENKARIGRALGGFVQESFLAPDVVTQRVRDAGVAHRAGTWLAKMDNARRAAGTLASVVAGVADVLDDESASQAISHALVTRVEETPAAPLVAKALEVAIEEGHHRALVDSILRSAGEYLDENRAVFRERITVESPWWVPEPIDDRIFDKVFGGAKRFLDDLRRQPDHDLRKGIDRRLTELVGRLRTDPALAERVEARKAALLQHPSVQAWAASLWAELKDSLSRSARDSDSELRNRLTDAVAAAGARLRDDAELQATVDAWFADAVHTAAEEYGASAAAYVEATVDRWDTAETTDRVELLVGRDLQFIRINGTIVGGLAGLVIYAVGQLL